MARIDEVGWGPGDYLAITLGLVRSVTVVAVAQRMLYNECSPGGLLGYLGGRIRSLSKLKITPKSLISGQKSTLILIKR